MKAAGKLFRSMAALCICMCLILEMIPVTHAAVESTGNPIFDKFISDSRWENGAKYGGSQKPLVSKYGSLSCCAYTADFVKYCFGKPGPREGTTFYKVSDIRAGDVLTVGNQSNGHGHWFAVLKRDGNKLYVAEGNYSKGKARVGWNYTIDVKNNKFKEDGRTFTAGYHFLPACSGHQWQTVKTSGSHYDAKCKKCGMIYNYGATFSSADSGYYMIRRDYFRLDPYQESPTAKVEWMKLGILNLPVVTVSGSVKNAYGNKWYKTESGYYIFSDNVEKTADLPPASTLEINTTKTSISITAGGPLSVTGAVTSNYSIASLTAAIDGKTYASYNPKSTSFTLSNIAMDVNTSSKLLPVGSHKLVITANDGKKTVSKTISIQVNAPQQQRCATPSIAYSDIAGGKRVTITQNTSGATLYYSYYGTDGRNVSTTNASVSFDIAQYAEVTAYSAKSGMTNSAQASREIDVPQLSAPTFEVSDAGEGAEVVIRAAENTKIRYSLDGANYQDYSGKPVTMQDSGTLFAYAVRNGCRDSEVESCQVQLTAPAAPAVSLIPASEKVSVNSAVMVSWGRIDNAQSYTVKLYKGNTLADTKANVTETNATFILNAAADYYFTVSAHNKFGDSAETASAVISAVAPLRVKFVDHDGAILSEQMVDYGAAAESPRPERRGYTFQGWDQSFSSVTQDMTITAKYEVITYTITYLDADGQKIGEESVDYGKAAKPPVSQLTPPSPSYEFLNWSVSAKADDSACNLNSVDSDMTAKAVFRWKNEDLPVTINKVEATWDGGNDYRVTVNLEAMSFALASMESTYFDALPVQDEDAVPDASSGEDALPDDGSGEDALPDDGSGEDALPDDSEEAPPDGGDSEEASSDGGGEEMLPDGGDGEEEMPPEAALLEGELADPIGTVEGPESGIFVLLRVSLKTAEGKMVQTESRRVRLTSAGEAEETLTLNYNGVATIAEAIVLGYDGDYLTGSTYSEAKTGAVTIVADYAFGNWSDWSEARPGSNSAYEREIEQKTQYRYRSKTKTTSTNSTLEGWIQEGDPVQSYSAWGSESAWTKTQPAVSDTLEIVHTRTVTDSAAYTQYKYYHWWGVSSGTTYNSYGNGYWKNYESTTSKTEFPYYKTFDSKYPAYKKSVSGMHGQVWWLDSKKAVPAVTHTEWTYRTRSAYNTYQFYQWSEWSDWQDTTVSQTADMQVETRTVYRYRDQDVPVRSDVTESEDKSGQTYTFSGTLPVSVNLTGKKSTVMVYKGKNSDPNESQLQYVGQITIGSGNRYDVSFKTREAPTVESGDYMVAMSLEGSTGLIVTDIIKAPVPEYTVKFVSGIDNALIHTERVSEGSNAPMPEPPQVEGYRFVSWSDSGTNIHGDPKIGEISITAHYVPNTYAVAFVDYVKDQVMLFAAPYGERLEEYAKQITAPTAEGYVFVRWDYAANATVTGNTIINAVYTPKEYTVKFHRNDEANTVLETQKVPYGGSARLPAGPDITGMTFLGWSTDVVWWNVKEDVDVYPLYVYNETAMKPESEVDLQEFIILSAEPGATIYYTLDGSEPDVNSQVYTGPIQMTEDTIVRAISIMPHKNESEILEVNFTYPEEDGSGTALSDVVEIGTYSIVATPGSDTTIKVKTNADLGLVGYLFTIECDRSVFYVDYDEESGFATSPGDASKAGMIFCSPYGDSGWQVLWFSDSNAAGAGDLFTLTLHIFDEAQAGTYPVTVSYSPSNTITKEDVEAEQDSIGVLLGGGNALLGDVNGDGYVTTVDVVRIARYIIDDFTLTKKQLALADVTGDKDVTTADVIRLARYLIGLAELG